ncbi:MAG: hypothetical protein GVY16_09820 [Planctomycetes bacterium]|jgi:hypothetical protein|nr:hypothetical protein [Phycisphaerae bacterium]NBB96019.1 hypothetical protein [Planctomycetota bacterium]
MRHATLIILAAAAAICLADEPASNLDAWLSDDAPAPPTDGGVREPDRDGSVLTGREVRLNALPGAIQLSNGRTVGGWLVTTPGEPWTVWVEAENRWRCIPPAAVLQITAKVIAEHMELHWRWKAMGEPEKVYTGKRYPFRRFEWTFLLADGSEIRGVVKGQPLWIETDGKRHGPWLLQERSTGDIGQSLTEHVYLKRAVISRRAMEQFTQVP